MFLQKFRHSRNNQFTPPLKQSKFPTKIQALLKKVGVPEIKQHQKQNIYVNPRTYLIENTKKMIKPASNETQQMIKPQSEREMGQTMLTPRKSYSRASVDLSSRAARRAAAKSFRERIWKSSDITPLVKAQEQRLLRSTKGPSFVQLIDNQEKIHRYHDSVLLREDSGRRDTARKEWLQGAIRNNLSLRTNSSQKNPEKLQITNIQFKEDMEDSAVSNHSRQILNRERRKELRMMHYSSLVRQQQRRPNTTGGYNRERQDDNIIQPW